MKGKHILWGLFFICAAALIIFHQIGYFTQIGLMSLIITILLIPVIVGSVRRLNFFGMAFSLAILTIVYEKPLGLEAITPWPVLIAALFLSIGLSTIFSSARRKIRGKEGCCMDTVFHSRGDYHHAKTSEQHDEDEISCSTNFGSSSKYVNSKSFRRADFHCSFGALSVYFDGAVLHENGAVINIDGSFCGIELYIPKTWNIKNDITAVLGATEEKNLRQASEGPQVLLTGNIQFGAVEIFYV